MSCASSTGSMMPRCARLIQIASSRPAASSCWCTLHSEFDGARSATSRLPALIGRGAVHPRNRHVDEAQVHGELAPMMNEVVDVRSDHGSSRRGKEHTLAVLQRPWECE